MKTILDAVQRKKQVSRLRTLGLDTVPAWGKLNARNLLPHLTDPFRIAMGEYEAKTVKSFFSTKLGKFIAIYLLPVWPKGAPTHPKTDVTKQGRKGEEFNHDMEQLISDMDRFVNKASKGPFCDHPIFGKLSNKTWGIVMNKHLEHHFRQFGI